MHVSYLTVQITSYTENNTRLRHLHICFAVAFQKAPASTASASTSAAPTSSDVEVEGSAASSSAAPTAALVHQHNNKELRVPFWCLPETILVYIWGELTLL
jgi:copper(I)-binding protein